MSRDRCERCPELRHLRARPAQRRFPSLWRLAGAVWQAAPVAEWRPVGYCAAVAPQSEMTEARAHEEASTRPCASSQAPALWTDQHGLVGGMSAVVGGATVRVT